MRGGVANPWGWLRFIALVATCLGLGIVVRLPASVPPRSVGSPSATGQAYAVARANFEKLMTKVSQETSEGMALGATSSIITL